MRLLASLALIASIFLAACGGGGLQLAQTHELTPAESYALIDNYGDPVRNALVRIGDMEDSPMRAFWRFDISGIPADANIISATFQTTRSHIAQGEPWLLGDLHVNVVKQLGPLLEDPSAMWGLELMNPPVPLEPTIGGFDSADVTDGLREALQLGQPRLNVRGRVHDDITDNVNPSMVLNKQTDAYLFTGAVLVVTYN